MHLKICPLFSIIKYRFFDPFVHLLHEGLIDASYPIHTHHLRGFIVPGHSLFDYISKQDFPV